MELTPQEIEEIELAVDRAFKKWTGFTYRGNDVPSRRPEISHAERNGD